MEITRRRCCRLEAEGVVLSSVGTFNLLVRVGRMTKVDAADANPDKVVVLVGGCEFHEALAAPFVVWAEGLKVIE